MPHTIDPSSILFQNQFITVFYQIMEETGHRYTIVTPRGGEGASVMAIIPPSESHSESRILVLAQNRPPIGGESWEFPSGAVDEGESGATAAAREFFEESGIFIHENSLIPLGDFHSSPTMAKDTVYLFATILPADFDPDSVIVQASEIDDYKWLTISELIHESLTNLSYSVTIPSVLMKARKLGLIESLGM